MHCANFDIDYKACDSKPILHFSKLSHMTKLSQYGVAIDTDQSVAIHSVFDYWHQPLHLVLVLSFANSWIQYSRLNYVSKVIATYWLPQFVLLATDLLQPCTTQLAICILISDHLTSAQILLFQAAAIKFTIEHFNSSAQLNVLCSIFINMYPDWYLEKQKWYESHELALVAMNLCVTIMPLISGNRHFCFH